MIPNHRTSNSKWSDIVRSLYPDVLKKTYSVPPVHFKRVPYKRIAVPGTGYPGLLLRPPDIKTIPSVSRPTCKPVDTNTSSLWPREQNLQSEPFRMQLTDISDDFAQNHVLVNLQKLGDSRKEVMFIISQLEFMNYLKNQDYSVATAGLNKPVVDGEFDFLIIHPHSGFLIGELKSVGLNRTFDAANVANKIEKAVYQLIKAEQTITRCVSDVAPGVTVRKTLFLPYVSSEQLEQVLMGDASLNQLVCHTLGASTVAEAVQLCCCSDALSPQESYWDVKPEQLSRLSSWWDTMMGSTQKGQLGDQLYMDVVARFVGPATSVLIHCYNGLRMEVRCLGEAVSEFGKRLAQLVLTLEQVRLMNSNLQRVCITGPPGTGKTLVMILQGLRWLVEKKNVEVVSTRYHNQIVNNMIIHQLRETLRSIARPRHTFGTVNYHEYDFCKGMKEMETCVTELVKRTHGNALYVLVDEAVFDDRGEGKLHQDMFMELNRKVKNLHIWITCQAHQKIPVQLEIVPFAFPIRSSPCIVREVEPGLNKHVHPYKGVGTHSHGDGPSVIRLCHNGGDHSGRWPVDCRQCGQEIAEQLRGIGVGTGGNKMPNSPAPLANRDVFVLTRSSELHDTITDKAGNVTQASGVVLGLRAANFPVCVLGKKDWLHNEQNCKRIARDVAVSATDTITVSRWGYVLGMERRVVVFLPGKKESDVRDFRSERHIKANDRIGAYSRCTTQLIIVEIPDTKATAAGALAKDDTQTTAGSLAATSTAQ